MEAKPSDSRNALAKIALLRLYLSLGYTIALVVLSLIAIALIAYYVFNGEWLPPIFVLLARKELANFFDGESTRLSIPDTSAT